MAAMFRPPAIHRQRPKQRCANKHELSVTNFKKGFYFYEVYGFKSLLKNNVRINYYTKHDPE